NVAPSHVSRGAQAFECVFRLAVHCAPRPLRGRGCVELGDDLVQRGSVAHHRKGDVGIAQRTVALPVPGEVKIDQRNTLALDVTPDIALGPMGQRMYAQMRARRQVCVEVVPELRGLVPEIPVAAVATGAEDALLGAHALLVAADAGDDAVKIMLLDSRLE